jgi:hypothetical protein
LKLGSLVWFLAMTFSKCTTPSKKV